MIHLVHTRGGNITLRLHVGNRYYDTGICMYMPQPYTMACISSTSVFDIVKYVCSIIIAANIQPINVLGRLLVSRAFRDLERMVIYFQGAGELWKLF